MKAIICLMLLACAFGSQAARFERLDNNTVRMIGTIEQYDADKLANILRDGDTLQVRSPGGHAIESIFLYYTVIDTGNITVDATEGCNSACANMALGADKIIGKLGFHTVGVVNKRKYTRKTIKRIEKEIVRINNLIAEKVWSNHFDQAFINSLTRELTFVEFN